MKPLNWSRRQFGLGASSLATLLLSGCASVQVSPGRLAQRRIWAKPRDNYVPFYELFESEIVRKGTATSPLPEGAKLDLTFEFDGRSYTLDEYQKVTKTYGLIVIKDGSVRHEAYGFGANRKSLLWSASMSKSIVSILAGIAVGRGHIRSVEDQITEYLPELKGTGYEGVRIRNALQMRSGVDWDDSFFVPGPALDSQIASLIENRARYTDIAQQTRSGYKPGSRLNYNSLDTAIIAWLVERAVGMPLSEFTSRYLWQPLGAEADAYWLTDGPKGVGRVFAAGGYNARLRDYARIGQMMLHNGRVGAQQVLPSSWVAATFAQPTDPVLHEGLYQYGYQWWLLDQQPGFSAIGGFGQYIHVNPKEGLVIAKNSWYPAPAGTINGHEELQAQDDMALACFAAIAAKLR
ncbi:MAG: serine hydrolase [Sphingorhabdus sp.]